MMGWMCPNCGSAHAPSIVTCPMQVQTTTIHNTGWPSQDTGRCPGCGKRRGVKLQIPRLDIREEQCMCPTAASTVDGDEKHG